MANPSRASAKSRFGQISLHPLFATISKENKTIFCFPSKLWRNENVFSLRPYGTRPPPESTHPAAAHEETLQRELSSFESVRDNYPKTLLTLDDAREQSYDGIRRIYALDWLLGKVEA